MAATRSEAVCSVAGKLRKRRRHRRRPDNSCICHWRSGNAGGGGQCRCDPLDRMNRIDKMDVTAQPYDRHCEPFVLRLTLRRLRASCEESREIRTRRKKPGSPMQTFVEASSRDSSPSLGMTTCFMARSDGLSGCFQENRGLTLQSDIHAAALARFIGLCCPNICAPDTYFCPILTATRVLSVLLPAPS